MTLRGCAPAPFRSVRLAQRRRALSPARSPRLLAASGRGDLTPEAPSSLRAALGAPPGSLSPPVPGSPGGRGIQHPASCIWHPGGRGIRAGGGLQIARLLDHAVDVARVEAVLIERLLAQAGPVQRLVDQRDRGPLGAERGETPAQPGLRTAHIGEC